MESKVTARDFHLSVKLDGALVYEFSLFRGSLITDIEIDEVHGSTFNNDAHVSLFCYFCALYKSTYIFDANNHGELTFCGDELSDVTSSYC